MALWLLGPDPAGNCCDCTGRTGPCDTCGEPDACPCTHNFGPDLSLTSVFPTLADAQFIIDNYTNNCFGVIQYVATFTVSSFTATETVDGFIFSARSTRTPGPADRVSSTMQVGFYAAAGTLTIDYSTSSDGSSGTVGNSAVLVVCSAGVYSNVSSQSVTSASGTFTFTLSTAALYIVRFQGTSKINASYVESSFDFSFSAGMVVAPAVALYDDSGTTRQLEACPKFVIPYPEFLGSWYASESAAQTALDTYIYNCRAYSGFPLTTTGYSFSSSGSSITISYNTPSTVPLSNNIAGVLCINLSVGENVSISASYSIDLKPDEDGCPACNPEFPDECSSFNVLVVVLDFSNQTIVGTASSTSSSHNQFASTSFTAPYSGKFYFIATGGFALWGGCEVSTQDLSSSISSPSLTVNDAQALYDVGLDCAARLDCS